MKNTQNSLFDFIQNEQENKKATNTTIPIEAKEDNLAPSSENAELSTKSSDLVKEKIELSKEAIEKYKYNVAELAKHNHLYHTLDNPEISDEEYDLLFKEVKNFEEQHPSVIISSSSTTKVGGEVLDSLEKKAHNQRMYGLDNVFDIEEFQAFVQRIKNAEPKANISFFADVKLDGIACELVYEKGKLVTALTRGDGIIGEDITEAAKRIANIPQELTSRPVPDLLEVRGEVLFCKEDFEKMNERLYKNNLPVFKNARNAAAGTLRQLDMSKIENRPLRFLAYSTTYNNIHENISWKTQSQSMNNLRILGFHTPSVSKICNTAEEAYEFYKKIDSDRDLLPYEIDGLVFKINDFDLQEALGHTARAPRFAFAWKFASRKMYTKLLGINIQIGRTGVLTPVAELAPVHIGGVTVSSATLHNEDEIRKLDLYINDTVLVERAGDVIPKIVAVDKSKRDDTAIPYIFPHTCPYCNSDAFREEGDAAWYCLNLSCPQIRLRSIQHFVGKSGLDMDGIGPKWIEKLIEKDDVRTFADLFRLSRERLLSYEGVKAKSADNFLNSLEEVKTKASLPKFITALGIRHIGEQTAITLAKHFKNIDNLIKIASTNPEQLQNLQDIGQEASSTLHAFFSNEENIALIKELQELGINPIHDEFASANLKSDSLAQKKILFTGTLSRPRSYYEKLVLEHGGENAQSVSKNLDILVVGENAGSKLDKAQKLGKEILDEEKFLTLIGEK